MNIRPSTFPLNDADQGSIDAQKGAASLADRYKNMLGSQAAGQNVGLFYQLEANALEEGKAKDLGNDVNKYDSRGPVEAGGVNV